MIELHHISKQKRRFMNLLLLGDEQEDMVERYLEECDLYALYDGGLRGVCAVVCRGGAGEIKNIAVYGQYQHMGYGRALVEHAANVCRDNGCSVLYVGTGDSPLTVPFYERCGFTYSHRVPGFFTEHYDHPIFEGGRQLVDMIYLKREL